MFNIYFYFSKIKKDLFALFQFLISSRYFNSIFDNLVFNFLFHILINNLV